MWFADINFAIYLLGLLSAFWSEQDDNRFQAPDLDIYQHIWNGNCLRIYSKNPSYWGKIIAFLKSFFFPTVWRYYQYTYKLVQVCKSQLLMRGGDLINSEFRSVELLSHVRFFVIPRTAAHQASLSIINSWSLLKLMSIESVMSSNYLILCPALLLLPSIFPSIRVFSND